MQNHALRSSHATLLIAAAMAVAAPASAETSADVPSSPDFLLAVQDSGYAVKTSEGAVTLNLQPRWENGTLFVDVRANTHTVPLNSLDLAAQVRLIVGTDSIAPDKAGQMSGHHSSTTLEFRVKSRPEAFTIEIRDVPDVPLRTLTWAEGSEVPTGDAGTTLPGRPRR